MSDCDLVLDWLCLRAAGWHLVAIELGEMLKALSRLWDAQAVEASENGY